MWLAASTLAITFGSHCKISLLSSRHGGDTKELATSYVEGQVTRRQGSQEVTEFRAGHESESLMDTSIFL